MNWIVFALLAAFFMALYNVFIKLSSGHIHELPGAVILQVVAALAGTVMLVIMKLNGANLHMSRKGIILAGIAGLSVGLAEILSFYTFSKGIDASRGVPVIIGGSILFAVIIGLLFLKESITVYQAGGIILIAGGVFLLAK
jgi:transporter family protein